MAIPPVASSIESLPPELLANIFGHIYNGNVSDNFGDLIELWACRRVSRKFRTGVEAVFWDVLRRHTEIRVDNDFTFHIFADDPTDTIAVFKPSSNMAQWSPSQAARLSQREPGWEDAVRSHSFFCGYYKVVIWDTAVEIDLPAFRVCFDEYNEDWILLDWVDMYNRFYVEWSKRQHRLMLERDKRTWESRCFYPTATMFKNGTITLSTYLDNHLAHLSGIRHPADRYKRPPSIRVRYKESDIPSILSWDLVAGAFRNCIDMPDFRRIDDVKPLKDVLMLAWNGDLPAIRAAASRDASKPYFKLPLLEVFIAVAFVQSHTDLLAYLLTISPAPATSIFDKIYTNRSTTHSGPLDTAQCWLMVIEAGWMHEPVPTKPLASHAARSADESAIRLFQYINARGALDPREFPLSSIFYYGAVGTARWALQHLPLWPSMLLHDAAKRPKDGPEMVNLLLGAGANVNAKGPSFDMTFMRLSDRLYEGIDSYPSGETALMAACVRGTKETVEALLHKGARRDLRDDHGESAIDKARRLGKDDILEILENWERGKRVVSGQ